MWLKRSESHRLNAMKFYFIITFVLKNELFKYKYNKWILSHTFFN